MSKKNRKIVYWSDSKEVEFLYHNELGDLVGERIDGLGIKDGKIKVYGWARKEVDQDEMLEFILDVTEEFIDERYFYENPHEQCEKIKEAAKVFVQVYAENTEPFFCDIVHEEVVDIEKWLKDQPNDA